MTGFESIILGISSNPIITVFLVTFFLGDETVYFLSFLSGQGVLALWIVILFSIIGNGGCDILWFSIARSKYSKKIRKFLCLDKKAKKTKFLKGISKKKMFTILCLSKFFYGTRILAIFYVAKKEKKFGKIFLINTLSVISWVMVIGMLMWFAGKWTSVSFDMLNNARKIIGFAVFFGVLIFLIRKLIFSKIIKKLNK
ncbi:MAG: hypothetical protein KJ646_04515 [Nanoarchaeota archaeon]|nr:hypothetical protein [Nanoarchaeota archaeon]